MKLMQIETLLSEEAAKMLSANEELTKAVRQLSEAEKRFMEAYPDMEPVTVILFQKEEAK
jgi:hypothetical protein